jgi:hypothetical protein
MKTNIIEVFKTRALKSIAEDQLEKLLIEGKPIMEEEDMFYYIKRNINNYLSPEEQHELISQSIRITNNTDMNAIIMSIAIRKVAQDVHEALMRTIKSKSFVGNNRFNPITEPKMFMLSKYFEEVHGIKMNVIDASEGFPF